MKSGIFFSALAFVFGLGLPGNSRAAELVFFDDFETGAINLSYWNPQVYSPFDGATLVTESSGGPVRSGEFALRIKLAVTDQTDPAGKHRSELRPRPDPTRLSYRAPYGVPHIYEFSLYLPADWQPDAPEIVAQWHGKPDRDAEGNEIEPYRSPPIALRMTYLEDSENPGNYLPAWNIVGHWDATAITPEDQATVQTLTILEPTDASGDLGTWVDWRFDVTWDFEPEGEGRVRVLKGGVEIASYEGPNAFNDDEGPNSKIGIYKWNWPNNQSEVELRVAYYDDVRIISEQSSIPALSEGGVGALVFSLATLGLALAPRQWKFAPLRPLPCPLRRRHPGTRPHPRAS